MVLRKQNGNQTTADYTTAFFVKDHLGSTRVMLNAQGDILERNAYYPFGLQMNQGKAYPTLTERLPQLYSGYISPTPARRDLYNGKEIQTTAGTDYIDYGFRQYDPVTARWMVVDPKAEKYLALTPYSYCSNAPISLLDPQGDSLWINYNNNKFLYYNGVIYNSDGSEYTGKVEGYLKKVKKALELLNKTEEGASLIDELQTSSYTFIIKYRVSNGFNAENLSEASASIPEDIKAYGNDRSAKGSGGIIYWNPYEDQSGVNLNGNSFRPSWSVSRTRSSSSSS